MSIRPDNIAGLAMWHRMRLVDLFQDAGGNTPVASNNDPVRLHVDRGSGDFDGVAASDGARPLYQSAGINSSPSLLFDGSNDVLVLADLGLARNVPGVTFWSAVMPTSTPGGNGMVINTSLASATSFRASLYLSGTFVRMGGRVNDGGSQELVAVDRDGDLIDVPQVWIGVFDHENGVVELWINGILVGRDTFTGGGNFPDTDSQMATIGGRTTDAPFPGHIGERGAHQRVLTDDEIAKVSRYLGRQYDIPIFRGIGSDSAVSDGRDAVTYDASNGERYVYNGAGGTEGFAIWRVTNSSRPVFVRHVNDGGAIVFGRGVHVDETNDLLYVTGRDSGTLHIYDLASDPEDPTKLGSYQHDDMMGARGVDVDEAAGVAYVGVGHFPGNNSSLWVLDISSPGSITKLTSLEPTPGTGNEKAIGSVQILGDYLYCSGYNVSNPGRVFVFDRSTRTAPTYHTSFEDNDMGEAREMTRRESDDVLFVSSPDAMRVFALDVSNPGAPTKISSVQDSRLNGARQNVLLGNSLYVSARASGRIVRVNVMNPANMQVIESWQHASLNNAYGIGTNGDQVFATSTATGDLTIIDAATREGATDRINSNLLVQA